MRRLRILLVAGELELRARLARELHSSGYAVELASDLKRALTLAEESRFRLAILAPGLGTSLPMMLELRDRVDEMLVLEDGSDEIARLRGLYPEIDQFQSSNEGALSTRVSEIIGIAESTASARLPAPSSLWLGDCKLDLAGHVFVAANDREVLLTRAESDLLRELAQRPCQTLSRDLLRLAVAGRGAEPFDRSIDMLVARLRRKIEPDPKVPRFLVTVPGVGYKLVVRTLPPESEKLGAEKLGAEPTDPERRQITAISCNLVGAMGLAANLDPEDLSQMSRDFQSAVVAAITGLGGTIAVVGPDEILAFFGLPEAHEDDAERAVSAGLEAMANIARLLSPNGAPLQARVGIATGLALASSRAAVGVPSVMATGVCNLAPPNSVVVTASTRRLLSGAFVCGDPERYELAGLPEAVSVCRVKRKRAVTSRFRAKHPNKITRNIGRDHELQQLSALWDRAKRGDGQVAFVCGDAGIGKSHLCEFLLGRLAKEPHATLRYQCSPNHLSSPFYPVIRQLEHAVRFKRRDTPAARYEMLKAALSQIVQPTAADMSAYASLLSIGPAEHEQLPGLDPQRQKDLAIAALIPLLLKFATRQPVIILLEDVHWIDPSSLELLNRIIPVIKAARVLLLITFRPEFIPQWPNDPHVTLLRLNRMGHDESHALISQVTTEKLPPAIEEQIIDRADGIPLFVEELTKTAVKSEAVQNITVRNIAADRRSMLAIPPTLLDSLTGRLDLLGPVKEIAQIGAVIGREFSELLLAAVAPESTESMRAGLAQLVASGVAFVSGEYTDVTYIFKHGLMRDAAYATLSRGKRKRLHSRIADALESNFRLIVQTQPERLAHHLAEAGLTERAIDYLQKAAQQSIERSANAEIIGYLTRALELWRSLPQFQQRPCWELRTSCDLARLWQRQGKTGEALQLLRSVCDEFTEGFDTAELADARALLAKLERNVTGADSRRRERHQERQGDDNQRVAGSGSRHSNGRSFSAELVARP